ncbi:hypothetical protein LG75P1_00016 [Lactococcus phage LG75P1]|nr:hypothetical protein LG75P1_00016 [Lactococcus phage LG75P1]WAX16740.1 hypothetical protein LG75P3_00016 [Lactococcus phage LG75P3]
MTVIKLLRTIKKTVTALGYELVVKFDGKELVSFVINDSIMTYGVSEDINNLRVLHYSANPESMKLIVEVE